MNVVQSFAAQNGILGNTLHRFLERCLIRSLIPSHVRAGASGQVAVRHWLSRANLSSSLANVISLLSLRLDFLESLLVAW